MSSHLVAALEYLATFCIPIDLGKPDLKVTRLFCRLRSSLVIRWLFNRVYISPRTQDLPLFNEITSDQRLNGPVKELLYDASYFDPDLDKFIYLDKFVDQVWILTKDPDDDELDASDKEINEFLQYGKGSNPTGGVMREQNSDIFFREENLEFQIEFLEFGVVRQRLSSIT
ncbi:hypothetical protein MMC08_002406 [Hypocenomyce scalaris]|nr:hypothetical protein [Hypocenomyce scalaris]